MKDAVEERKIDYVWHFTRLDNLDEILRHGLVGRSRIVQLGIDSEYRFDGQEEAICCSLGHPNYKMFYRLRQETPSMEWGCYRVACFTPVGKGLRILRHECSEQYRHMHPDRSKERGVGFQ